MNMDALADSQVQNTQTEDIDDNLTGTGSTLNTSDTTGNAAPYKMCKGNKKFYMVNFCGVLTLIIASFPFKNVAVL